MEKAIRKYWPLFVLPTMLAFAIGFLIPFVILEIIRPILKISPKMTFHNAIMHPFNSVMLNLTQVHTHTHTHTLW